ncbi:G-type lectin S-receptor-like serine/threonine-protein kinase At1g11300 [Jatropha curcas]|uniref:G-type lectin S-receptor-like serine/threonine-protein kinase At1g11300 n=1 Tax=Jatropha curcas TaxID=180498 RepID=UPI001894D0E5|nr:G-type lectin S-receptor-like serine/threonine-protein kinase At1g11300 [Jatropha curcas]
MDLAGASSFILQGFPRLRIIHIDSGNASNSCWIKESTSKISALEWPEFFGGNEDQAILSEGFVTRRVVGTYGYMSPEYAMGGRFSEKSDMFSFGVLLLEIAWKLWNEGNNAALVDPVVSDPCYQAEISRCIHVGLLCVQEFAKDRPTVSTVISMLNSEIVDLPIPKQPAFTERQVALDSAGSSQQSLKNCSVNLVFC